MSHGLATPHITFTSSRSGRIIIPFGLGHDSGLRGLVFVVEGLKVARGWASYGGVEVGGGGF